jgi:hypothetical protein
MALRPFFMVSSTPSAMGFFALHLTQYPSDIKIYRQRFMHRTVLKGYPQTPYTVNSKRNTHTVNDLCTPFSIQTSSPHHFSAIQTNALGTRPSGA